MGIEQIKPIYTQENLELLKPKAAINNVVARSTHDERAKALGLHDLDESI